MTDIVERLRAKEGGAHDEAADYIEMLRGRVIAFESLETKRIKDAVTAEDWRRIAEHMEYNWRCCSDGFNKICGELRQQLAETQEELRVCQQEAIGYREQLAECQVRIIKTAVFPIDKTLLDNLIKQAKHESVLRVIAEWEKFYGLTDGTPFIDRLRRMAKELK